MNQLSNIYNKQQLVDVFARTHDYLRISLTDRCNLRCFYCMPEDGIQLRDKSHFMRSEEIYKIAEIFTNLGVRKIRLTGGEPLVRKGVADIIRSLGSLNAELAITTNGILVDQFIDTFKEAGIRSVNVSLDSLNKERQVMISRRDFYSRIIQNIDDLLAEGIQVKLNMVIMKDVNDDEIIDFIELTKSKPLHVRFIEFMPFSGNRWNWKKGIGFEQIMNTVYAQYGEIKDIAAKPNDTAKNYAVDGYLGTFGIISSITHPFCATCNRIRLTADGKIKNCLFSPEEMDILTPLRNDQDIIPLIISNVHSKKVQRAGLNSMDDLENTSRINKNRTMVAIGG